MDCIGRKHALTLVPNADNSTSFEGKMQRLVDTAADLCGVPTTLKVTKSLRY